MRFDWRFGVWTVENSYFDEVWLYTWSWVDELKDGRGNNTLKSKNSPQNSVKINIFLPSQSLLKFFGALLIKRASINLIVGIEYQSSSFLTLFLSCLQDKISFPPFLAISKPQKFNFNAFKAKNCFSNSPHNNIPIYPLISHSI